MDYQNPHAPAEHSGSNTPAADDARSINEDVTMGLDGPSDGPPRAKDTAQAANDAVQEDLVAMKAEGGDPASLTTAAAGEGEVTKAESNKSERPEDEEMTDPAVQPQSTTTTQPPAAETETSASAAAAEAGGAPTTETGLTAAGPSADDSASRPASKSPAPGDRSDPSKPTGETLPSDQAVAASAAKGEAADVDMADEVATSSTPPPAATAATADAPAHAPAPATETAGASGNEEGSKDADVDPEKAKDEGILERNREDVEAEATTEMRGGGSTVGGGPAV
ncbi:hypothetical protein KC343_g20665 [Hortaea werneckii]|nr:hypothetical protein KC352_g39658 [Hortaea werneckii]KAI7519603.1 hypothetical protein KC317_g22605 [Hortaea werneckii]KAI7566454.1 hypothetical protein KC346_g20998 [Hortaea werneckii]KAI7580319.1 hypothetical protein KC343_g20665 [Hortaea werneckii]KAI7612393.1 hypothetical protein KC319_g20308 [Hortaea werneckii]